MTAAARRGVTRINRPIFFSSSKAGDSFSHRFDLDPSFGGRSSAINLSMIEIADLVLLMVDGSFGFEMVCIIVNIIHSLQI